MRGPLCEGWPIYHAVFDQSDGTRGPLRDPKTLAQTDGHSFAHEVIIPKGESGNPMAALRSLSVELGVKGVRRIHGAIRCRAFWIFDKVSVSGMKPTV